MTGQTPDPAATESPATAGRWSRRVVGPFTLRHLVILAIVLGIATLLLALLRMPVAGPATPADLATAGFYQVGEPTTGLAVGQVAPELAGTVDGRSASLLDLDGRPLSLEALRGQPVWLSFFATWCPPCQRETPVLREAWERYGPQGLAMVAVSVQETTPADVAAWAETYDLDYPIGFDASSAVFHTYAGFGLPTHVFIDRAGIIRTIRYGPLDEAEVAAIVEPLLAASPRPAEATSVLAPSAPPG